MSRVNDELESLTRMNKRIWDETYRRADQYASSMGKVIDSIDDEKLNEIIQKKNNEKKNRIVKVLNENPLNIAQILFEKGVIPLVINSGSQNDPTKIIESGPIGAEWDLFRRSNICNAITYDTMYPLTDNRTLYYPKITVFRSETFDKIQKSFEISVLTINPISRPGIIQTQDAGKIVETYESQREATKMQNKINRMFEIALLRGHNCIIVNDFGCQSELENPIQEVIKMFNDAIEKYPVRYVFFAIHEPLLERLKRKSKHDYKNYILFHSKINRITYT